MFLCLFTTGDKTSFFVENQLNIGYRNTGLNVEQIQSLLEVDEVPALHMLLWMLSYDDDLTVRGVR